MKALPPLVALVAAGLVACGSEVLGDSEFDLGGSATGDEIADEVGSGGSGPADTSTEDGLDGGSEGGTGQESWEWTCPNPPTPSECTSPARPLEILSDLDLDPDPSCLSQWTCAYEGKCTVVSVSEAGEIVVELDCEPQAGDTTLPQAIHYAEHEAWEPPAPGTELELRYLSSDSDVFNQGLSAVRVEDGQGQLVFAYVKTGFMWQLEHVRGPLLSGRRLPGLGRRVALPLRQRSGILGDLGRVCDLSGGADLWRQHEKKL